MRLVNSDSQIVDAIEVKTDAPVAVSSSKSDGGKSTAHVICAVLCAISATIAIGCAYAFHDDSLDLQDQYQKERNHVIELEARQKALADEISYLKQEVRQLGVRT